MSSSRGTDIIIGLFILFSLFAGFLLFTTPELFTVPFFLVGTGFLSFFFSLARSGLKRESLYVGVWGGCAILYAVFFLAGPPRALTFGFENWFWPGIFWTDWVDSTIGFRHWGVEVHIFKHFFWAPFWWVDPASLSHLWWWMALLAAPASLLWGTMIEDSRREGERPRYPAPVPHITEWAEIFFGVTDAVWTPLLKYPARVEFSRGRGLARLVALAEGIVLGSLLLFALSFIWRFAPGSEGLPFLFLTMAYGLMASGIYFAWAQPKMERRQAAIKKIELARRLAKQREDEERIEREQYFAEQREKTRLARERAERDGPAPAKASTSTDEIETEDKKEKKTNFWSDDNSGDF